MSLVNLGERKKKSIMEPKDQMNKEMQERRRRMSGQVGQNQPGKETGYSSATHNPTVTDRENPRVRVSRDYDRKSTSEDSDGNFLKKILSVAGIVAGGAILYKAVKGKGSSKAHNIQLHTKQTIKRPKQELYAYWRNLENLPNFMSHIREIREIDERRSRWTAEIPGGVGTVDWEAVIERDRQNEYISWRSVADSDIQNSGEVRFKNAGGGKATVVETTISYSPPAGKVGEFAAKLLNPAFEKIVKSDLKQFKKYMEEGGEERSRTAYGDILY